MLIAGESAAELPRMCGVVTRHYERETSHLTKNLSIIIEPILILLITGVVLIVALAIFMPMWSMVELLG
jgi:MSHA biogenesis protein MshG